jgi:hypothetical protein
MIPAFLHRCARGRNLCPAVVLAGLTLWLSAWTLGLLEPGAWSRPMKYEDDSLEIMARLQLAASDPTLPLRGYDRISNLGAPHGADWRGYRLSDGLIFSILGALARWVGVVPAWHVGILTGFLTAALVFYGVARHLHWPPLLAAGLGLVYALGTFNVRWAETLSLNFTFFAPLLLLLSAWLARPGAPAGSTRRWRFLAGGLGLWMGMANPYFLYFGLPLVAGAVGLHLLARPHPARWQTALCFLGAATLAFAVQHHGLWSSAQPLAMERNYAGSVVYGLKFTDLVLPPAEHRWHWWSNQGAAYPEQAVLPTEFYSNYLGFLALAGLLRLSLRTIRRLAKRPAQPLPGAALAAGWLLAMGMAGGLNSLVAYFGMDLFRAGNRVGVLLFALGLLAAGAALRRLGRGRSTLFHTGLVVAVTAFSLWDLVLPPRSYHAEKAARRVAADEALAGFIAGRQNRPPRIFQFPATTFPEAPSIGAMHDYEHLRPWLTRPAWQLSYGALRGSESSRWIRGAGRLPPRQLARILAAQGFDAVWIDRRAYPQGTQAMTQAWVQAGAEPVEVPRPDIIWLQLPPQPAAPGDLSDFSALAEPWLSSGPTAAGLWLGAEGWYDFDRTGELPRGRWARDQAAIAIHQPRPRSRRTLLSFHAAAISGGELSVRHEERVLWEGRLDSTPRPIENLVVDLPPGVSRLHFAFDGRIRPPHRSRDTRQLGFRISRVSFTAPAEPALPGEARPPPPRGD